MDLKPDNILLKEKTKEIKISDFGISNKFDPSNYLKQT